MLIPWLGYVENVDRFTFREEASLTIPKPVRERAFSLQVDVEIVSTDGNDYTNSKSIPEYGFYGYAVLVFRNYAEIQIPIAQPRQRLYYGRVNEAYVNWYQFYLWRNARASSYDQADVLGQIGQAVGLGNYVIPPRQCVEWSGFEELPLRELYIKCRFGTQFRVEISRWKADYEVSTDGCPSIPTSKQTDDVKQDGTGKDNGLPPLGVQPQKASNSSNPYSGLPSASTNNELGEFGNNKINSVDFPNPDNAPIVPVGGTEDGVVYNVTIQFSIQYYNGNNELTGTGLGEVYFPNIVGVITSIFQTPSPPIYGGDFIGVVSADIHIVDKFGERVGTLNSTNVFPPFSGVRWSLFGINGFEIVPV